MFLCCCVWIRSWTTDQRRIRSRAVSPADDPPSSEYKWSLHMNATGALHDIPSRLHSDCSCVFPPLPASLEYNLRLKRTGPNNDRLPLDEIEYARLDKMEQTLIGFDWWRENRRNSIKRPRNNLNSLINRVFTIVLAVVLMRCNPAWRVQWPPLGSPSRVSRIA